MNTLPHAFDPHQISARLGTSVQFVTRESDYLFPDGEDIAAAIAATVAGDPLPVAVPEEVDALAFELTLHNLGLHAAVLAYVETLPPVEQIYWRRRPTMRRNSALIEAGRVALGLTVAQIDALFVAAGADGDVIPKYPK